MLGQLAGLSSGGGMSASSGASASQENQTSVSSGGIHVGGLTMGGKSFFDSDMVKVAVIGAVVLVGIVYLKNK